MTYTVKRVKYGKKGVPVKLREFRLSEESPVGTIDEIMKWAAEHDIKQVKFVDPVEKLNFTCDSIEWEMKE